MPDSSRLPLVSIVIPVYNGADYLDQAIDSALAQTWPNVEVIVIDDGSDDGGRTAAVAARYGDRIHYEAKPNGGVATAANHGIRRMQGTYFSWLSHDDVYVEDKIERQMAEVTRWNEPVMVFGDFALMDADGREIRQMRTGEGFDPRQPLWAVFEGRINGCSTLVHRSCFERCGLFHPELPTTQDYDLWFRIGLHFPIVHVPGVVVRHRVHAGQGSQAGRHREEATLLWLSMLDRMPREAVLTHAPSEGAFLARLERSPIAGTPAMRAAVERMSRAFIEDRNLCAVFHRPLSLDAVLAAARSLRAQRLDLRGIAMAQVDGCEWRSVHLNGDGGSTLTVELLPTDPADTIMGMLARGVEVAEAEFLWLSADADPVAGEVVGRIRTLTGDPDAVVCLIEYPDDHIPAGAAAVLEGAVFRCRALRQALAESTGTLTSLMHALSRLGAIVSTQRLPRLPPPRKVEDRAPPVAQPPATLNATVKLSMMLGRRPLLAGLVWRIVRPLAGADAGKRLAVWAGVDGRIDPDWYRLAYPDVAAAGIDPVFHYLVRGHREGRDPSPHFNTFAYGQTHADVVASGTNPLQHYAVWGLREGRRTVPSDMGVQPLPPADGRPTVLVMLHHLGGGVARFASDLAEQVAARLRVVFLCGRGGGEVVLGMDERGDDGRRLHVPAQLPSLISLADALDVRRVLVLHLMGFDEHLPAMIEGLGRPFDVINLDYALVAAQPHLAGPDGRFVGDQRLPAAPKDPQRRWLIEHAQTLFACSDDLARRLARLGLERPITVAPPPDPERLRRFRPWARPVVADEPLRIALFSVLLAHKGRAVVVDVLERVHAGNLPLRFVLFGTVRPPFPPHLATLVHHVPVDNAASLTRGIAAEHPHLAWFPFQVPETHSYAVTDAIANGLPIAASAIGAVTERLRARPLSWLLPWDAPADDWLALFLRIHREGMHAEDRPAAPESNGTDVHDAYRKYLYATVLGEVQWTASQTQGAVAEVCTTR